MLSMLGMLKFSCALIGPSGFWPTRLYDDSRGWVRRKRPQRAATVIGREDVRSHTL